MPSKKEKKKSKFKKMHIIPLLVAPLIIVSFLMYGPITYFRDEWITTAMGTGRHQWLATMFFDKKDIDDAMSRNKVIEPAQNTNAGYIQINPNANNSNDTNASQKLPDSPKDGERIIDGIGFIKLKGSTYNGWMIKIYDPTRIYMAKSKDFGSNGEKLSQMVTRLGAFVGINASGFPDAGGEGNGEKPDNFCIMDGVVVENSHKTSPHSIIGIDYTGRLILGKYTTAELSSLQMRYAVEFSPFFIVNGEPSTIVGNGGGGIAQPRTAIGQTPDGTILFAVIDGRRPGVSDGATFKDLQKLMLQYGAYNAANLDGGSSSTVVVNGEVINNPSSLDGERYLPNAFLIGSSKSSN